MPVLYQLHSGLAPPCASSSSSRDWGHWWLVCGQGHRLGSKYFLWIFLVPGTAGLWDSGYCEANTGSLMELTIKQGKLANPLIVNKYVNTMGRVLQKISAGAAGQETGLLPCLGSEDTFLRKWLCSQDMEEELPFTGKEMGRM